MNHYKIRMESGSLVGPKFSTFKQALSALCHYDMDRKNAGSHWPKAIDVVECGTNGLEIERANQD